MKKRVSNADLMKELASVRYAQEELEGTIWLLVGELTMLREMVDESGNDDESWKEKS